MIIIRCYDSALVQTLVPHKQSHKIKNMKPALLFKLSAETIDDVRNLGQLIGGDWVADIFQAQAKDPEREIFYANNYYWLFRIKDE